MLTSEATLMAKKKKKIVNVKAAAANDVIEVPSPNL